MGRFLAAVALLLVAWACAARAGLGHDNRWDVTETAVSCKTQSKPTIEACQEVDGVVLIPRLPLTEFSVTYTSANAPPAGFAGTLRLTGTTFETSQAVYKKWNVRSFVITPEKGTNSFMVPKGNGSISFEWHDTANQTLRSLPEKATSAFLVSCAADPDGVYALPVTVSAALTHVVKCRALGPETLTLKWSGASGGFAAGTEPLDPADGLRALTLTYDTTPPPRAGKRLAEFVVTVQGHTAESVNLEGVLALAAPTVVQAPHTSEWAWRQRTAITVAGTASVPLNVGLGSLEVMTAPPPWDAAPGTGYFGFNSSSAAEQQPFSFNLSAVADPVDPNLLGQGVGVSVSLTFLSPSKVHCRTQENLPQTLFGEVQALFLDWDGHGVRTAASPSGEYGAAFVYAAADPWPAGSAGNVTVACGGGQCEPTPVPVTMQIGGGTPPAYARLRFSAAVANGTGLSLTGSDPPHGYRVVAPDVNQMEVQGTVWCRLPGLPGGLSEWSRVVNATLYARTTKQLECTIVSPAAGADGLRLSASYVSKPPHSFVFAFSGVSGNGSRCAYPSNMAFSVTTKAVTAVGASEETRVLALGSGSGENALDYLSSSLELVPAPRASVVLSAPAEVRAVVGGDGDTAQHALSVSVTGPAADVALERYGGVAHVNCTLPRVVRMVPGSNSSGNAVELDGGRVVRFTLQPGVQNVSVAVEALNGTAYDDLGSGYKFELALSEPSSPGARSVVLENGTSPAAMSLRGLVRWSCPDLTLYPGVRGSVAPALDPPPAHGQSPAVANFSVAATVDPATAAVFEWDAATRRLGVTPSATHWPVGANASHVPFQATLAPAGAAERYDVSPLTASLAAADAIFLSVTAGPGFDGLFGGDRINLTVVFPAAVREAVANSVAVRFAPKGSDEAAAADAPECTDVAVFFADGGGGGDDDDDPCGEDDVTATVTCSAPPTSEITGEVTAYVSIGGVHQTPADGQISYAPPWLSMELDRVDCSTGEIKSHTKDSTMYGVVGAAADDCVRLTGTGFGPSTHAAHPLVTLRVLASNPAPHSVCGRSNTPFEDIAGVCRWRSGNDSVIVCEMPKMVNTGGHQGDNTTISQRKYVEKQLYFVVEPAGATGFVVGTDLCASDYGYKYLLSPLITGVHAGGGNASECRTDDDPDGGRIVAGCPTTGGERITITGTNFEETAVFEASVDGRQCAGLKLVSLDNQTAVTCTLPRGIGLGRTVVVEGILNESNVPVTSRPYFGVSYAEPRLVRVMAGRGECEDLDPPIPQPPQPACKPGKDDLHLVDCVREGGFGLTVVGANLGTPGGRGLDTSLMMAGIPCVNSTRVTDAGVLGPNGEPLQTLSCPCVFGGSHQRSIGVAVANGGFSDDKSSFTFRSCPPGTMLNAVGNFTCVPCQPGEMSGASDSKECTPCEAGKYNNETAQSVCRRCPAGRYTDSRGQLECTQCGRFQYTTTNKSIACLSCNEDAYMSASTGALDGLDGNDACASCPGSGATCPAGDHPAVADTGFWLGEAKEKHISAAGVEFYGVSSLACLPGRCVGGCRNETDCPGAHRFVDCAGQYGASSSCCGTGRRLPASENPMCAHCAAGLSEWGGNCVKCDSAEWGPVVGVVLVAWAAVLFVYFVSRVTRDAASNVAFFHVQALLLLLSADTGWQRWLGAAGFQFWLASGSSCLANVGPMGKLMLELFAPLLSFVLLGVTALIHAAVHTVLVRGRRREMLRAEGGGRGGAAARALPLPSFWTAEQTTPYLRALVSLAIYTYNALVGAASVAIQPCVDLPGGGAVVARAPAVDCDDPRFKAFRWCMAAVLVLLVACPPLMYAWLRRPRSRARIADYHEGLRRAAAEQRRHAASVHVADTSGSGLGVLYQGYAADRWYWQAYSLGRRLALVLVAAVLSEFRRTMVTVFALLVLAFLLAHLAAMPFRERGDNVFEFLSLTLLLTLSVSMIEASVPFSVGYDVAYALVLFFYTCAFLVYLAHNRRRSIKNMVLAAGSFCSCCRGAWARARTRWRESRGGSFGGGRRSDGQAFMELGENLFYGDNRYADEPSRLSRPHSAAESGTDLYYESLPG